MVDREDEQVYSLENLGRKCQVDCEVLRPDVQ